MLLFRDRQQARENVLWAIQRFREKNATSPDKAMSTQELGLPPAFEAAMKRKLGQLGIFVEVNGKYYLSEEKLKETEEHMGFNSESGT
jgi:hypothetical protein